MSVDNTGIDYTSVLADLKAKREALDQAIAGLERWLTGQAIASAPATGGPVGNGEIQHDTFFNMSIADAARKLLAMKKASQTTQEIADALEKGGMTHTSGNWANTVGSVLNRINDAQGDITKIKRGTWGLAAWYPGKRRVPKRGDEQTGDAESEGASEKE